ncbi:MAG: RNA methyltransferase [Cyanobacteria bacterium P01_D01_bin.44]
MTVKPSHELIVCASLVDNPVNLGGLCRTCEGFGVTQLVVSDLAVRANWAFRKVSASGHRWQAMAACAVSQLPAWLVAQQQQGYEVVALTVGPSAQLLNRYAFAQRTVLLLGRELTGIPVELLRICDRAITIPQYGQIESLNVQTAAAIAIYEYIRQYRAGGGGGAEEAGGAGEAGCGDGGTQRWGRLGR